VGPLGEIERGGSSEKVRSKSGREGPVKGACQKGNTPWSLMGPKKAGEVLQGEGQQSPKKRKAAMVRPCRNKNSLSKRTRGKKKKRNNGRSAQSSLGEDAMTRKLFWSKGWGHVAKLSMVKYKTIC